LLKFSIDGRVCQHPYVRLTASLRHAKARLALLTWAIDNPMEVVVGVCGMWSISQLRRAL